MQISSDSSVSASSRLFPRERSGNKQEEKSFGREVLAHAVQGSSRKRLYLSPIESYLVRATTRATVTQTTTRTSPQMLAAATPTTTNKDRTFRGNQTCSDIESLPNGHDGLAPFCLGPQSSTVEFSWRPLSRSCLPRRVASRGSPVRDGPVLRRGAGGPPRLPLLKPGRRRSGSPLRARGRPPARQHGLRPPKDKGTILVNA